MKKILIVCMLCFGLSASADNNKLDFNDLWYAFDYGNNKCKAQRFDIKKFIFNEYNNGTIIVTNKIDALPGNIVIAAAEFDGKEKTFTFASTYGACKLFEDAVIRKMDVDPKNYVNMKEKK